MSEEKLRKRFHKAVDRSLNGLTEDAMLCQRILHAAGKKQDKPAKKKYTAVFIAAALLLLSATTVFAFSFSRECFQEAGEIQANSGAYDEWSPR